MAEVDILLVLDGIKGEAQDKAYKDSIEVTTFDWGGSAVGADSPSAGRVRIQDVTISKRVDAASMGLWSAMAARKPIKSAKFIFRRAGGGALLQVPYLEVTLTDVFVVGISFHNDDEMEGYTEEKAVLNFSKVDMTYTQQGEDGGKGVQSAFSHSIPRT